MQTKGFLYSLCKVGENGMLCHGQPFVALNDEVAKQQVAAVYKDFENEIDANSYRLVCLCGYDMAAAQPIEGLEKCLKTYPLSFVHDDFKKRKRGKNSE